jgi:hypothetical protein
LDQCISQAVEKELSLANSTPLQLTNLKPLDKLHPVAKNGLASAAANIIPVINLNEIPNDQMRQS